LQKSAKELGVDAKRITDAALARLSSFDFPGNVRQLENICHWLTVMAPAQVIEAKDLPPELLAHGAIASGAAALPGAAAQAAMPSMVDVAPVVPASLSSPVTPRVPVGEAPVTTPTWFPQAVSAPIGHEALAGGSMDGADAAPHWLADLERESRVMLEAGVPSVWDTLTRKFEAQLIHTALEITRGRRIEAAQKLGIGRNTITRKIQELGLDD
jgi:two-component system nitrogen regulation response regulator GlnG